MLIAGKGHEDYQEANGVRAHVLRRRGRRRGARPQERRMMDTATAARAVAGHARRRQRALRARDDRHAHARARRPLRRACRASVSTATTSCRRRSSAAQSRRWSPAIARRRFRGNLIAVPDPRAALLALAAHWRAQFGIPVVVVVGSNGKTTVKEMLASILRDAFRRRARARDRRQSQQRDRACR